MPFSSETFCRCDDEGVKNKENQSGLLVDALLDFLTPLLVFFLLSDCNF